jgi:hypothetical protein
MKTGNSMMDSTLLAMDAIMGGKAEPRDERLQKFLDIDITDDGCDNCPHFCEERDPYNTGDSPTEYSCEGSVNECPRME